MAATVGPTLGVAGRTREPFALGKIAVIGVELSGGLGHRQSMCRTVKPTVPKINGDAKMFS